MGQTQNFHHFEMNPSIGKHSLTFADGKRID